MMERAAATLPHRTIELREAASYQTLMSSTNVESHTKRRLDHAPAKARHARALRIWLGCLALLVVAMVLVGGATRLTDSGLSITEWKPVTGVIPPRSESAWQEAFNAYQQIPEYLELKRGMSLDEFKTIYWWEWGHRFLGRLIGVAFLLPFLAFWIAGFIPRALLPRLVVLFVLGALQGAVGWYMVKSGLVTRVDVSQYRLAAHLGVAVLIFGFTLWLIFDLGQERSGALRRDSHAPVWAASPVLALIFLQILAGGLVAGLDAGFGYNTWPLINGAFVPNGLGEASPWFMNLFENPLTVQFDHRMLAYTVVLVTIAQAGWLAFRRKDPELVTSAFIVMCFALLQATLGVWTLLLRVPIPLGLAHQAGAMVLFAAALYHLWLTLEPAASAREAQAAASA
jgi:cytochrome c oxidase assembly protein subunit 15